MRFRMHLFKNTRIFLPVSIIVVFHSKIYFLFSIICELVLRLTYKNIQNILGVRKDAHNKILSIIYELFFQTKQASKKNL